MVDDTDFVGNYFPIQRSNHPVLVRIDQSGNGRLGGTEHGMLALTSIRFAAEAFMSLKYLTKKMLDPLLSESLILALGDFIKVTCIPERIILFGSAARREMTDMSDLDVIVLLKNKNDLDLARKNYFKQRPPIDYPIDILFMTTADYISRAAVGGVCFIAEAEGRILYQSGDKE